MDAIRVFLLKEFPLAKPNYQFEKRQKELAKKKKKEEKLLRKQAAKGGLPGEEGSPPAAPEQAQS
jgi:hypothetical protein